MARGASSVSSGEKVYTAALHAERVSFQYARLRRGFLAGRHSLVARSSTTAPAGGGRHANDVLRDVSLAFAPGELVAVIGPNGAGKSSLLRVLSGTIRPRCGTVRLFGRDVAELAPRDIARRLAVVSQATEVAFGYRVEQVVLMGRSPHQGRMQFASAADHDAAQEAMERAGVRALAERPLSELSGGEQKLVALARALAQMPEVLLLDEPSAHLDPHHAIRILDIVASEVQKRRLACVLVAHDLNLAAAFADRVVLLEGGEVRADGPVEQVMTEENLVRAFGVEFHVQKMGAARAFVPRRPLPIGSP